MGEQQETVRLKRLARLRRAGFLLLPALTALLLLLASPKFSLWWAAWFALAPLSYFILGSKTARGAAAGGFAGGFLFYAGLLYWIYPTMRAGGIGPGQAATGLALLAALQALEFGAVSLFGWHLRKAGCGAWPYVFASSWALMEWGKVSLNKVAAWFPWFTLAYTQWNRPEPAQIVSVTGIYGLSWAVCLCGALLGAALCRRERPAVTARLLAPAALLFAGLWLYGARELGRAAAPAAGVTVKTALLQPCVALYDKWQDSKTGEIEKRLAGLVKSAAAADLVVWPENALPGWIEDERVAGWLGGVLRGGGAVHLVGSVSRGDGRRVAAFLLAPDGTQLGDYHKRVLVPFGEYVPLRGLLGRYVEPVAALGEFVPGSRRQELMTVKGVKVSPMICYESVFPYLFREDAARGAQLFVNITNDGWYLDTAAPYQHLAANVFRAIENRRPLLRAANNGISAYIDPYGRILASLPLDAEGTLGAAPVIDPAAPQSFYTRNGDLFAMGCAMLCAAFLLALVFL